MLGSLWPALLAPSSFERIILLAGPVANDKRPGTPSPSLPGMRLTVDLILLVSLDAGTEP